MTYDAVRMLLEILGDKGSSSPDVIREGLAAPRDFVGATGMIRYDGSPDPQRGVVLSRITNGENVFLGIAESPPISTVSTK